jgi:hypothetical protein
MPPPRACHDAGSVGRRAEHAVEQGEREYFEAIERRFIERRGRPLLLSPEDVARASEWHAAGIPLEAVLEGIDIHFDRMTRRGRAPRRAVTLAYVEDDVTDAWAAGKQRRLGRSADEGGVSGADASLHAALVASLLAAAERLGGTSPRAEVAEALRASAKKLEAKASLFDVAAPDHDPQKTEDHLRRLEKSLLTAAREALGHDPLAALEAEVAAELADKRARMAEATYARVSGHLLDKRLRERFGIPRLSLFYT